MESGLQELKFSRYNQKVELSGKLFLYNALTGGYASVDEEYRDNFDKCDFKKLDSMKELAELPNAIINQLMEGGFIIPKNFDEFNVIKSMHYRGRFGANKALTMTLIPTMNCNFRCPYCYEKDKKYPVKKMTTEVMDAIIKYVESRIDSVDHIFVTWYGGEPLLGLHEIRIMQNKLIELASQKDVQVSGMIITNGYGLTKEISDELVQMQIKTAQVTIDGPEEIHNRTRFLKNGEGTYRRIINNLLQANENLEVVIRVNIQKENIKYVPEFVDSLKQVGIDKRNNIKPYFSLVRDYEIDKGYIYSSCFSVPEFSEEESKLRQILLKKGFQPANSNIQPKLYGCGAVSPNSILVEPDGTLQKCWNVVGDKNEAIGNIMDIDDEFNGTLQELINESKWYAWSEFENEDCKNCEVLPLCMDMKDALDEISGFWGHVGIKLCGIDKYMWYPINSNTRKMIYKGIDEELMVIPCMNNKVLFLNMSNIEDITLSDFDADTPSGKNWDEHVSCGEIPLVVYEALEDYEENSQVTLYNDTENSTELYKYLMEYVRKNGWTEEDIFQLLNTSVFYYLDGRKKSTIIDFYQDSDDIIETIEMVYGYDFTDIEQNFMFYIDAHDETENFVNLKGISMMELPLLKVEEEIFRRNDQ